MKPADISLAMIGELLDFKGRFAETERKYDRVYGDSQHEIMKVEVGMALVLLE